MAITKKKILKTAILPGIIPRLKEFLGSGFSTLSYLVAVVYSSVRILPKNHPYLRPDMKGKYSTRQVIAEAANHIQPNRKNIDQIIIFFSIIAALVLFFIQFLILAANILITKANAQVTMPEKIQDFFTTPNPKNDIAYRLLDLVFGIPDFFGSQELTSEKYSADLHVALQGLFEFYSLGILVVGAMIIIYLVVAVIAETAQSGTPFGQRFNKAWAPIRIVLFFGLLIPISYGFNGGQYITLASAKLGSNFATTGWITLNDSLKKAGETLTGKEEHNVAKPKASDLRHIPAFMMIVKTCQSAYNKLYNPEEQEPEIYDPSRPESGVKAWLVYRNISQNTTNSGLTYKAEPLANQSFQDLTAPKKSYGQEIHIIFGIKNETTGQHKANISPKCGSIVMRVTDISQPGTAIIQTAYFDLIKEMWSDSGKIARYADNFTKRGLNIEGDSDNNAPLPEKETLDEIKQSLRKLMEEKKEGAIDRAVQAQIDQGRWELPPEMAEYGWGGAGIWYNKIAEQNGALVAAIREVPLVARYPEIMEITKEFRRKEDKNTENKDSTSRASSTGGTDVPDLKEEDKKIGDTLNRVRQFWETDPLQLDRNKTGNPIIDTINTVLGTNGLLEICDNADIHPLAQLSMVGKSMIDSAISSFAMSGLFGLSSIIPVQLSASLSAASGFFGTIAGIGLVVGFILFYILPFMPFIYFFFAVGGWVKSIFEAMVAVPLWAIAHLRIDGESIPGEAALGGYFLIFEIFIRPILIVFGLLAAITIFAALIKVLNEIFYLVVSNVSGHSIQEGSCFNRNDGKTDTEITRSSMDFFRGPVDEFFFTILYTIIVYMIGMSCFKLIDSIPNNILRWINAEVSSFNDDAGDSAEGLIMFSALGGNRFGSQIGGSLTQLGSGLKGTAQNFFQKQ